MEKEIRSVIVQRGQDGDISGRNPRLVAAEILGETSKSNIAAFQAYTGRLGRRLGTRYVRCSAGANRQKSQ